MRYLLAFLFAVAGLVLGDAIDWMHPGSVGSTAQMGWLVLGAISVIGALCVARFLKTNEGTILFGAVGVVLVILAWIFVSNLTWTSVLMAIGLALLCGALGDRLEGVFTRRRAHAR